MEPEDYARFLPGVLAAAGIFVQWLRQYSRVHDAWTLGLIPAFLAAGGYAIVADFSQPWRQTLLELVVSWPGYAAAVVGGTMGAARVAASGAVGSTIPQTNSR